MIIWLASYPRSGNFWLQTLLGNQFKRPTIKMYSEHNRESTLRQWISQNKEYYDIDVFDTDTEKLMEDSELFRWMATYSFSGNNESYKTLLPGCVKLVKKAKIREILAKDNEYYFVKTHLLPFSDYFDGEYVIQIVRSAGASLWSYYNFKKDIQHFDGDLSDIIRGNSVREWGNWTGYHEKWLNTANSLGLDHYMQVRYENLFNREIEFCEKIQSFLGLPIVSTEIRPFHFYHSLRPTLARKGKATGWEENYSKEQLKLLWDIHGRMMSHFGYSEPNYDLGLTHPLN